MRNNLSYEDITEYNKIIEDYLSTDFNKSFERPIKNANLLENEDWALLGLLSENSNVGGRPQKNGDIYS